MDENLDKLFKGNDRFDFLAKNAMARVEARINNGDPDKTLTLRVKRIHEHVYVISDGYSVVPAYLKGISLGTRGVSCFMESNDMNENAFLSYIEEFGKTIPVGEEKDITLDTNSPLTVLSPIDDDEISVSLSTWTHITKSDKGYADTLKPWREFRGEIEKTAGFKVYPLCKINPYHEYDQIPSGNIWGQFETEEVAYWLLIPDSRNPLTQQPIFVRENKSSAPYGDQCDEIYSNGSITFGNVCVFSEHAGIDDAYGEWDYDFAQRLFGKIPKIKDVTGTEFDLPEPTEISIRYYDDEVVFMHQPEIYTIHSDDMEEYERKILSKVEFHLLAKKHLVGTKRKSVSHL